MPTSQNKIFMETMRKQSTFQRITFVTFSFNTLSSSSLFSQLFFRLNSSSSSCRFWDFSSSILKSTPLPDTLARLVLLENKRNNKKCLSFVNNNMIPKAISCVIYLALVGGVDTAMLSSELWCTRWCLSVNFAFLDSSSLARVSNS